MSRPRRLAVAGAFGAVAVLSYGVVSSVIPRPASRPAPPVATRPVLLAGGVREEHPRLLALQGYPTDTDTRSEAGAVRSAVDYLELLDQAPSLSGVVSQLRAMTRPPLTEKVLRAEAVALTLTDALGAGGAGFTRGWRLGWRVTTYTQTTAQIAVWSMGIVESPAEIVAPDWSTTVCVLRWSPSGWKVAASHSSPGPAPPSPGASQAAVASFVRSADGFHAFADAP